MGSALLTAILKIVAKNPELLESLLEAGLKLAVQEMQKAVNKAS